VALGGDRPESDDLKIGSTALGCQQTCGLDLEDFATGPTCVAGPSGGPCDSGCGAFDFQFGGNVDVRDLPGFQNTFGR